MSLEKYKEKRRFNKTPEPTGGKSNKDQLTFVIQKHHASHLHYDFRLELRGVLKSWAVPKGPSVNPKDRRLAQLVEDHPFDYKDFEGIIPEGNYGAGTVIIWDQGTYEPVNSTGDKEEDEKLLTKQFWAGAMKISLHGKKLKGQFALVKTPDRSHNAWLLTKVKDKYAKDDIDISQRDQSVVSGMSIEEMQENEGAAVWHSNRSSAKTTSAKKKKTKKESDDIIIEAPSSKNYQQELEFIKREFQGHRKTKIPTTIKPMEATLIDEPFSNEQYLFEIKWDGYRCIAYVVDGEVNLRSKSHLPFNKNYPSVVSALREWNINAVLDGEIVVLNNEGKPDFNALQNYGRTQSGNLFYHVFDILWLDGINLMQEPLEKRKQVLKRIVPENTIIRFSDSIDEQGEEFFGLAKKNGLEGIIAKKKNSYYFPDTRSKEWLKLPVEEIKEYVIVGYTESEHGRPFARIMFGNYHEDGKLYYVHHTGGGMSDHLMNRTFQTLKKIGTKKKPVVNQPEEETPMHWVKPQLVGRFKQKSHERTKGGKIRHPVIFLGLREDIEPTDVIEGKEIKSGKLPEIKKSKAKTSKKKNSKNSDENFDQVRIWKTLHPDQEIQTTDSIDINKKEIIIINKDQEYWMRITKWDIIMYYAAISGYLLPFLKDRPLGLRIISKWAGEEAEHNFIRNMKGHYPSWVDVFTTDRRVEAAGKGADIDWVVCNDQQTLIYLLNLGALDFHPWASRTRSYEEPDYIVIDLDAKAGNANDKASSTKKFKDVIKVAQAAKEYFDENGLTSFVKTSGKSGMHLLVPCKGISYDHTRIIAENICAQIHERIPKGSTIQSSNHARGGKVYIDPSQNDYGDRLVAPYCVRAYKQPYISAPLSWDEVNNHLDRHDFTMGTMKERLENVGDLWGHLLDEKIQKQNSKLLKQFMSVTLPK
jgi:bifunctional non-homologous end joining protein LigD